MIRYELHEGVLILETIGDHEADTGFEQFNNGLDAARQQWKESGQVFDLVVDLTHSREKRNTAELRQTAVHIKNHVPPLSGSISIIAPDDYLFGQSRLFSAHAEKLGLTVSVKRAKEKA